MLRFLQVTEGKELPIRTAAEAMTRGGLITVDYTDDTVDKATANTGFSFVDVAPNYDGINAMVSPTDSAFEDISDGALIITVPAYVGERYATSELTIGTLSKGDLIVASSGKFVAASSGTAEWRYGGLHSDPSGITMYIVEKVAPTSVG